MRRFGNCKFYKEKREHGKDRSLNETDKHLKGHERYGCDIRSEKERDRDKHFAGEDVAEETEGKRDKPDEFRDQIEPTPGMNSRRFAVKIKRKIVIKNGKYFLAKVFDSSTSST